MTAMDDGRARRLVRHEVPAVPVQDDDASVMPLFLLDDGGARRVVEGDDVMARAPMHDDVGPRAAADAQTCIAAYADAGFGAAGAAVERRAVTRLAAHR